MSGHSKWATIKRKKAKEDAKRGKQFTTLIKEITIVARMGGGDPSGNPRLRTLLDKAKEVNMPIENATRAIKRGTGELPGASYEAILYEGYAPHGIAVMIDTLTDNKNRTVAELRHLFSSQGGNLGEKGAVSWMFHRAAVARVAKKDIDEDTLIEALLDYEVTDISQDEDEWVITADPKSLDEIRQTLEARKIAIESAELEWIATTPIELPDDKLQIVLDFLDRVEEHSDVKNLYTNLS